MPRWATDTQGPPTPMDQDGILSYVVGAMRFPVTEIGYDSRLLMGCYKIMSLVPELARVAEDRIREEEYRLRDELKANRAQRRIIEKIRAGDTDWAGIERLVINESQLPGWFKARFARR